MKEIIEQSKQKEEKMKINLEELETKPEGYEILDQRSPVSDEKNLDGTIYTAAKDAVANNAIRVVEFGGKELYVSPVSAEKILSEKEIQRIKDMVTVGGENKIEEHKKRYFIREDEGAIREVNQTEWQNYEERAGLHPKEFGTDATSSFVHIAPGEKFEGFVAETDKDVERIIRKYRK